MASRTKVVHATSRATASRWSTCWAGQAGATATEYLVLVGLIGLAVIGGVSALQAATTTAVDSQSDTIGTSPQFAQMPAGSGGPATNPGIPVPPPPPPPAPSPDPQPDPDPDPQPDPDPDPDPPPPTVAFDRADTRQVGQNWRATVALDVTNASQVTLSYSPVGTGSGTVTCTVSNGRCVADAGDWRRTGNDAETSVVFTVTAVDGQPPGPGQGATFTVTWP